jgi:hypothetical protein
MLDMSLVEFVIQNKRLIIENGDWKWIIIRLIVK